MSITGVALSDYVEQLKRNGFTYARTFRQDHLVFVGKLDARGAEYPCEFVVPKTLDSIPLVKVGSLPKDVPKLLPHLDASGYLCYLASGSVALDLFDPIGQTLACLQRAGEVLADILSGERLEDLADEFFAYWGEETCVLDIQGNALGAHPAFVAKKKDDLSFVVTDDKARSEKKLGALGYELEPDPIPTIRVGTKTRPFPLQQDWPPKDVGALLRWQSVLDPACRRRLEDKLLSQYRAGSGFATIIIDSPSAQYGVGVVFKRPERKPGRSRNFRQELYAHSFTQLSCVRIDDKYMAERSLPNNSKTLAGLNVVLVGCGTIGGFLAEMLVKAGAGTSGGKLTLLDNDRLGPQNLGRHRLGMPHIFKNKALQLAKEFMRLSPGSTLEALPRDVKSVELGKVDLLIDATGAQALTDWLMWKYGKHAPVLATWVEGPGLAVRALMMHAPENGCSRCISQPPNGAAYQVFDEPTPTVLKGHGCEGLFVPFPATASIQAAVLAMEMVQEWLDGRLEHTLQTRVLDRARTLRTPDCTPPRQQGCLACKP